MNTPHSPFAPLQTLQEEQREGCVPTPKTDEIMRDIEAIIAEKDAKITEQAAQIVARREQLGSFVAQYGCSCGHPACRDCWRTKDANEALSAPAPPVVPLADVTPLLDALKIIAANPGASHGPNFLYDSGPIATGAIAKFNAKHPQP